MKYRVMVSVSITPVPQDDLAMTLSSTNSLYHQQQFEIGGPEVTKFSQIAPTIDGVYEAIQHVVEASRGNSD